MLSSAASGNSSAFVWSDKMSVGVPEIDGDHQVLIELIGQIEGAMGAKESENVIGTVLNALADYTEYHFAREEAMQKAVGYPAFDDHKQVHEALKGQVMDYLSRYAEDANSVNITDLSAFLKKWLVEHIMKEDFGYKPYCENNPKASEAAASVGLEFFMEDLDD